ncbi:MULTISPECIES: S1 family peptidase [Butyricimonas]|uniref:S1 family peptidase n=1 Tax=Butyricimonas TaxID=574697 RepID=UPI0007FB4BFB|nr:MULTISPECIES: serine protease [Butyricimonas]
MNNRVMGYYCRLLCVVLLGSLIGTTCRAQQEGGVVYRDYTRREAVLLDSLKRGNVMSLFKGINELKKQVLEVKESAPVNVKLRREERRKLLPEEIIERRRESVLTVNKYLRAMAGSEMVTDWATAVVLSENGICVTNYHVFGELLDAGVKLNPRDSVMFVAAENGRVYPIMEVLSFNRAADMAFFRIDTRGDVLVPMPVGRDLPIGSDVHLLSNPEGYPYTYTRGIVSRTVTLNPEDPFANRMEMTADFAKGSSGGPIMDDRGNMVAMVSCIRAIYYSHQPPYYLQMNVKLTVPVSAFRRLIEG